MEKRYQVFISSTFQDLQPARQEVSQALLRADCFPAGMELFPAADEEQFAFIKQIIDQSDYYIIISAGRYGSIHPETGLSYTEMEYDYAVQTKKPIVRLLHNDPLDLAEEEEHRIAKLMNFREKLRRSHMVEHWENPDDLGKKVVFALLDITKRHPATGWVRANEIASKEALEDLIRAKARIEELERKYDADESDVGDTLSRIKGKIELKRIARISYNPFMRAAIKIEDKEEEGTFKTECSEFAKKLLSGLLYEDSIGAAVFRAYQTDRDKEGRHKSCKVVSNYDLDFQLMELEALGLIRSGETIEGSGFSENSFATRTLWTLTDNARKWAIRYKLDLRDC